MTDPLRIHLSLVSHTNIGKTTLARTLLMRDVGEIADRAHVTETTDDYVLARAIDGSELVLWDTPGFGNSVQLAKRLEGRANPVGWFFSEVWDRFTNKAFWLDQRAVRHIRDTASIVLYLVNVEEVPARSPYVPAEMKILSWIGKPVIVLLNQMGPPREAKLEAAEIDVWRQSLAPYDFVKDVLPMDAFARCWVQESALFDAIGRALPTELQAAFSELRTVWLRGRRAIYSNSVEAIARHIRLLLCASEPVPAPSLKERALNVAKRLGLAKSDPETRDALADAQAALASEAADSFCALTNKLIDVNGLSGKGVSKEILRRMKTDWHLATYSVDAASAAAIGTGLGAASGAAAAGFTVDAASGGLSLGLGTLIGGLIGYADALYTQIPGENEYSSSNDYNGNGSVTITGCTVLDMTVDKNGATGASVGGFLGGIGKHIVSKTGATYSVTTTIDEVSAFPEGFESIGKELTINDSTGSNSTAQSLDAIPAAAFEGESDEENTAA